MFFVGATGQLLTLLLTVCLPFVFLVSGQKMLHVDAPSNLLVIHQNQNEVSFNEATVLEYSGDFVHEENNACFVFDDIPIIQKFPFDDFQVRWKSVFSKSSGNKAPPSIHYFPC
jgi:hypothetical protein